MKKTLAPGKEQFETGAPLIQRAFGRQLRGLMALVLCFCLTLGLLPAPARAAVPTDNWADAQNYDTSWYDSAKNRFTLYTPEALAGFAQLVNTGTNFRSKTVRLGADLDLSGHLWAPIGTEQHGFAGEFDGCGKSVSGMILSSSAVYSGFFGNLHSDAEVHGLSIKDASITSSAAEIKAGILAGYSEGSIYDCAVSGSLDITDLAGFGISSSDMYVGGLVGYQGASMVKNCDVQVASITAANQATYTGVGNYVGGVVGGMGPYASPVENCLAYVANVSMTGNVQSKPFRIAPKASYSFWDNATVLTDDASYSYHQCCGLTPEQMAGTDSSVIASGWTYANTPSAAVALTNWAVQDPQGSRWQVLNGRPMLSALIPGPPPLDITVVPTQDKASTAGGVNADVALQFQLQQNVELISVTLPASIPFIMNVDGTGALGQVLSGTATLSNRSEIEVTVTLDNVADSSKPLLDKADFVLVPDPLPAGGKIPLAAGSGKGDVLAVLAPPVNGTPTTAKLKVDGTAKADVPSIGNDGDAFAVRLTLKVTKTA